MRSREYLQLPPIQVYEVASFYRCSRRSHAGDIT